MTTPPINFQFRANSLVSFPDSWSRCWRAAPSAKLLNLWQGRKNSWDLRFSCFDFEHPEKKINTECVSSVHRQTLQKFCVKLRFLGTRNLWRTSVLFPRLIAEALVVMSVFHCPPQVGFSKSVFLTSNLKASHCICSEKLSANLTSNYSSQFNS